MPSLHHKLGVLSRDRTFLIRATFGILAVFFFAGLLVRETGGGHAWLVMTSVTLTGLIWFLIITKIGGVQRLLDLRILFSLIAVGLGILSAEATLWVIEWQRGITGLKLNGEPLNDILFCICDIGLREEVIKMLFVIPLIPFVLRRRDEAEMLLVSSCVGLGFAINENTGYFSGISANWGRFLTANFFHLALTGAVGLALFRFVRWPKSRWEAFLGTLIAVILIHGAYDALLMVNMDRPGSNEAADTQRLLWFILYCVIAHRHIDLVFETRDNAQQKISPLGVFVLGSALIIGLTWILACDLLPWDSALQVAGGGTLANAMIAFLFINRLRSE